MAVGVADGGCVGVDVPGGAAVITGDSGSDVSVAGSAGGEVVQLESKRLIAMSAPITLEIFLTEKYPHVPGWRGGFELPDGRLVILI